MLSAEYAVLLFAAIVVTCPFVSLIEAPKQTSNGPRKLEAKKQTSCREPSLHRAVRRQDTFALTKYVKEGGDLYLLDCQGRSAMHLAVAEGSKTMVSALLGGGFNLNHGFPKGDTVIKFAVENRTDFVPTLTGKGADINFKDPKGKTMLHSAVENARYELIVRLIQYGADIDATDKSGDTPLTYAVRKKSPEIVYLLLTGGANIKRITKEFGSYLHLAVRVGCADCLKNLLSRGLPADTLDTNSSTALVLAVTRDDVSSAVALADSGADIHQKVGKGTLLHLAAEKGSPNCIRWLVEKGLPPDSTDQDGRTPIMLAVEKDDTASAAALVEGGADVEQQCGPGTLLHLAAERGSARSIGWLVQQGIPPDASGHKGLTPMMLAIQRDDTESLSALEEFGVDLKGTLLHFAVRKGSPNSIRWLIQQGLDPDSKDAAGRTPIMISVELDDPVTTRTLGENGADLFQRVHGGNLLHYAARKTSPKALRWLAQHGPPIEERDSDNHTPIVRAADQDDVESMAVLADAGADLEAMLNSDDVTLLHHAASKDSIKAVKWLVEQGLDVNQTDTARQWHSLHHAAFHNKLQAVKLLLELDACKNCKDKWNMTPIMRAIEKDNTDLEAVLVTGGVDLHTLLEDGTINLLHFAATRGSLKSIRWLVQNGMDIDEADKSREWTPLHHASFHGKLDSVKIIVDLQSFINFKDKWGQTPLTLAKNFNHPDVVAFLETRGGRT